MHPTLRFAPEHAMIKHVTHGEVVINVRKIREKMCEGN